MNFKCEQGKVLLTHLRPFQLFDFQLLLLVVEKLDSLVEGVFFVISQDLDWSVCH